MANHNRYLRMNNVCRFHMSIWIEKKKNCSKQCRHANINWRNVQTKSVVNNVDMSCLRASWQNGPYKHKERHKNSYNIMTQQTFRKKLYFCVFRIFLFLFPFCQVASQSHQKSGKNVSTNLLSYSIINLLGFIDLTLTFISGILGIKEYSMEIIKQL